ncbi:MAG: AbrB/MazE/SpoVT family DNA-binding domain-containing protein [Burkholderiales bacterium]|nr:AbrB/MazE/SpoVT family DNA-binding domain-containing protein [Burkholderiales bacterium]
MSTTMTLKGQVTIPKHIRDSLGLKPGAQLDFAVNRDGDVVLHRTDTTQPHKADRFEAVRGKADVKWRTHDLMALLRGDD